MAKKKLPHFEVHMVYSQVGSEIIKVLIPTSLDRVKEGGDAPDGRFCVDGYLYLPKRKNGEKFKVLYTTIHEVIM